MNFARQALARLWTRRHVLAFDLTAISNPEHRAIVQGALNACDYPFMRVRRATGVRIPVKVADTSRYDMGAAPSDGHDHAHDEQHAAGVHALTDPADARRAALGLFWLPTPAYPAGRIELSHTAMGNPPLVAEVFLAEAAHAVDYAVMTDAQRAALFAIVHHGDGAPHGTHGWWEERGGHNYWSDWVGETFMALFMRAFAPTLPRPLEARQPWTHKVDNDMANKTREVLL